MADGAATSAVIASEPLTKHTAGWLEAPEYSMLVFTLPRTGRSPSTPENWPRERRRAGERGADPVGRDPAVRRDRSRRRGASGALHGAVRDPLGRTPVPPGRSQRPNARDRARTPRGPGRAASRADSGAGRARPRRAARRDLATRGRQAHRDRGRARADIRMGARPGRIRNAPPPRPRPSWRPRIISGDCCASASSATTSRSRRRSARRHRSRSHAERSWSRRMRSRPFCSWSCAAQSTYRCAAAERRNVCG